MPAGAHGRHLFVHSIKRPVAMTPTLAIVVVVEALTPRHHHRSSSARGWHSDTGNCSSSAIGPGFGFGYEQGKNYVNEFRVSSLAWEMPFNGYQRPPNYYYDNCLTGVTSSLLG